MTGAGPDEEEVAAVLTRFMRAFDEHDWSGLAACLAPEVRTDYGDLRGTPPSLESAAGYADARRAALDHLDMEHTLTNVVVQPTGPDTATASADFRISRFARKGGGHFHSWGTYAFALARTGAGWRITAITQRVQGNDGDPALHRHR